MQGAGLVRHIDKKTEVSVQVGDDSYENKKRFESRYWIAVIDSQVFRKIGLLSTVIACSCVDCAVECKISVYYNRTLADISPITGGAQNTDLKNRI